LSWRNPEDRAFIAIAMAVMLVLIVLTVALASSAL
jgi:hypothetical protein